MPSRCILTLICLSFLTATHQVVAKELVIRHRAAESKIDTRFEYRVELIKLAMEKTIGDGPYRLQPAFSKMTHARVISSIQAGNHLDIVSFPTTREREEKLHAIRFPIMKGLLGYRIFFIKEFNQKKYATIKTFEDLQKFTAGVVSYWPDVDILRRGRVPIVTGSSYASIWNMLELDRFDYFPRGANEIWAEARDIKQSHPDIIIEKNIAIYYPLIMYFFIGKHNTELIGRMERGLQLAFEDGSFEKLFMRYNSGALTRANLKNRLLFKLADYPQLPDTIPFDRKEYWIDPTK